MKMYLVGGAVRDILLGRTPREHDVAFEGSVANFLQMNPGTRKVGKRIDVYILDGVEHRPVFHGDIQADLAQRDFTINALALESDGRLHAHPHALEDLRDGVIRPASPHALHDDPLRVFRAARFAAQLPGFVLAPETRRAMREVSHEGYLDRLPKEQVCRETLKALGGERPSRFFEELAAADCLTPWFAELSGASDIPAGPPPRHSTSLLGHMQAVIDALSGDPLAVWLGVCHDLGKVTTPADMLPRHIGHEKRSEVAAVALGQRLGMPMRWIRSGALAARLHMKGGRYGQLRAGTRVDLLMELHTGAIFEAFWALVKADTGMDHSRRAAHELEAILAVRLPSSARDKGEESGRLLRDLRCQALAHHK